MSNNTTHTAISTPHTEELPQDEKYWTKEFFDLVDNLDRTRGSWTQQVKKLDTFIRTIETAAHAVGRAENYMQLQDYIQHEEDCITQAWSAGRPTEDGGYECKIAGKWYQTRPVDKTPKCTCGLEQILKPLEDIVNATQTDTGSAKVSDAHTGRVE